MLTAKREAFAVALASGMSQSAAYRVAFPKSASWKDASVWDQASKLAANPEVRQRATELATKAAAANEVTVERVVRELARVAFGDRRRVMSWGPSGVSLMDSEEIDEADAAMVAEVSETTTKDGGSIKMKTHDKVKALELLGKHVGMFTEKVELTGRGGGPLQSVSLTASEFMRIAAEVASRV